MKIKSREAPRLEHMDSPGDNVLLGPDCPEEFVRPTKPVELESVDQNFVPGPTHTLIVTNRDAPVGKMPGEHPQHYCDSCDFHDLPANMKLHHKYAHGGRGKSITWDEKKALKAPVKRAKAK